MNRSLLAAICVSMLPCAGGIAANAASTQTATASGAMGTAKITGVVKYAGPPPTPAVLNMESDAVCKAAHPDPVHSEEVVVNDNGTLRWAFVYVKEGVSGKYPVPSEPVVLDQHGCLYHPHVFGVQVRQKVEIRNSDKTLHNVHAMPTINKEFNVGMPLPNQKIRKKFKKPEIMVKFKCDVHSWMSCYAGVLDHPFYSVSGEDGSFTIENLPAGTYTIEAWTEKFGTQTQQVTVGDGETKQIEFSFPS